MKTLFHQFDNIDVLELAILFRSYIEGRKGGRLEHVRAPLVQTWRVQA